MENWGNIVKTDHKAEFNLPFVLSVLNTDAV